VYCQSDFSTKTFLIYGVPGEPIEVNAVTSSRYDDCNFYADYDFKLVPNGDYNLWLRAKNDNIISPDGNKVKIKVTDETIEITYTIKKPRNLSLMH